MPFNESNFFCMSRYGCSPINLPLDAEVLAPFVKLTFFDAGKKEITVGNNSSPTNNTAIIKSFQYGQSDGAGAEVEIYDEEGGDFKYFVSRIAKSPGDAKTQYRCVGQWGWLANKCSNSSSPLAKISSCHSFSILSCDINISGKGIIFRLELLDLMEPLFETRINKIYNLPLKQAIRQMFREANPSINNIEFRRKNSATEFKFSGNVETVACKYSCNNQTPLAAAREWVSRYRTERDKGIIIFYDNTIECQTGAQLAEPKLVFLEDPLPKCFNNDVRACDFANGIGTYIVNGGKHSPVISFDPKIKFNFSVAARASVAVGSAAANAKIGAGQPCPPNQGGAPPGSGSAGMVQITEDMNRTYGRRDAVDQALVSHAAQERANKIYENVEAELRIQGDPNLDRPFELKVATVSIIVINPFHLAPGDNGIDWLVRPPCNDILSNRNWRITGVYHEIKEGSYTTTLKVYLPEPGSN